MAKVIVNVTKADLNNIIKSQNGKIFTAYFRGVDNRSFHAVNGRTGVHKFSSGGKNHAAGKNHLVTAFSMPKMNYRNINLPGVYKINANGVTYRVID